MYALHALILQLPRLALIAAGTTLVLAGSPGWSLVPWGLLLVSRAFIKAD